MNPNPPEQQQQFSPPISTATMQHPGQISNVEQLTQHIAHPKHGGHLPVWLKKHVASQVLAQHGPSGDAIAHPGIPIAHYSHGGAIPPTNPGGFPSVPPGWNFVRPPVGDPSTWGTQPRNWPAPPPTPPPIHPPPTIPGGQPGYTPPTTPYQWTSHDPAPMVPSGDQGGQQQGNLQGQWPSIGGNPHARAGMAKGGVIEAKNSKSKGKK